MKKISKVISILLMLSLFFGVVVACKDNAKNDILVVSYSDFSSKFSPFFAKTSYDQDVALMTQITVLTTDRQGNVIYNAIEGEKKVYNGTEYTYKGAVDFAVEQVKTGEVIDETKYTIKIRDDLKFSDGVAVTIDDLIFSLYVLSDPTYSGSSTFSSQPVQGMEEYRTNGVNLDTMKPEAEAYLDQIALVSDKMAGVEG